MKWFRHFSDASHNDFITRLEDEFGLEGYARWFKLVEAVAAGCDHKKGVWSVSHPWTKWQSILKGKRKKLEQFIEYLEKAGRIKAVHSENKPETNPEQTQNKPETNRKLIGNILEIEIPKLREYRDNYTKDLQATGKPRARVLETDTEVEEDKIKHTSYASQNAGALLTPAKVDPVQYEAVREAYHRVLPSLPRMLKWTNTRKGYLKQRWKDTFETADGVEMCLDTVPKWEAFFRYIGQSPWLMGAVDPTGDRARFEASLDWIIKPNNFAKILEGRYHRGMRMTA